MSCDRRTVDMSTSLGSIAIVAVVAASLCIAVVRLDVRIRASAWSPPERVARTIGSAVMPAALVGSAMVLLCVLSTFELLLRL